MEHAFTAMAAVLGGLKDEPPAIDTALAASAWRRCAGDVLLRKTAALDFEAGILTIAVEDATWKKHLTELRTQFLFKLRPLLAPREIEKIKFVVDAKAVGDARAVKHVDTPEFEVPESIKAASEAIADPDLRKTFVDAAGAYLNNQDGR